MKVYIVTCGYHYEGSDVKAVLASRQDAERVADAFRAGTGAAYDIVHIEEWHVGQVAEITVHNLDHPYSGTQQ